MKLQVLAAAAALSLAFTGASFAADGKIVVSLKTPVAAKTKVVAGGAVWNCEGATCVAAAAPAVPAAASARPAAENAVLPASTAAAAPAQADLLAAYRRQLAELFARHQEYPRVAALRGWEGEVRLRLTVARKGNLLHIEVERSSGYGILDQHALAMVGELSGLPALPAALEGNEIQVLVPVNYKLKKTT